MANYKITEANEKDHEEILDFLNEHFVPHEPINAAINLCDKGYRIPFFDDWQLGCLKNERNISLIARDEETNSLQGVIIMEVISAEVKEDQNQSGVKLPRHKQCPDKMAAIFTFLDWIKSGLDVAQVYGVSEWVDLAILCCNTDTRTPGLGTQLCIRGLKAVQDKGFKVVTSIATSHFSGKIFQKQGFDLIRESPYTDYKVDGNIVFPTKDPHTHFRLFVKKF